MEIKVFSERLALSVLVITANSRDISAVNVPNFKSSGAKIAKGKVTGLTISAFALFKRDLRLLVIF